MKKILSAILTLYILAFAFLAWADTQTPVSYSTVKFSQRTTTPSAPATGKCITYFKNDAKLYYRCAGGSETAAGSVVTGLTDANNVTIGGGTINGTAIGSTTPAAGTFTTLKWSKGADIASATTTDLATATGNVVDITGTTTINSFGTVAAGATYFVRFTGSLTLTYNATSIILPGARDLVTAAGETMILVSLGGGNWMCHTAQSVITAAISADATLSGTPVIITIYDKDTGTPYYFKAYPTKP